MKKYTFIEAFKTGNRFRHVEMKKWGTPVWFKKHSETEVHGGYHCTIP